MNTTTPTIARQLSIPLVALASGLFLAGVIAGGVTYLERSPERQPFVPGTDALWQHIILALVASTIFIVIERRRAQPHSPIVLLAPLGKSAAHRIRYTFASVPRRPKTIFRLLAAIPPAALLLFGPFRMGIQVLGGLDPNFTVNAWGGPSYLGAMAFHYFDGALMMVAAAWLLDRLLLRDTRSV
ncbi:hypothetical protein AB0N05_15680 [Nocardia sp. NPDC051030]|uniref:hypothetical protein n=1 Tax=Nocardia sp. NPDC051030 TaxID=3155162 RepID=UPI0034282680